MLAAQLVQAGADDVHADAAPRDGGDLVLGGQPGQEHQLRVRSLSTEGIGLCAR